MPRVTINGDDFGMNQSCTQAIIRAIHDGLITDTTMMANGTYFNEAAALAKSEGVTDRIGIHFNLTEGQPLTREIGEVPLFVKDGSFHRDFLYHPRALNETESGAVFAELCAQVQRIVDHGLSITHADSHHYFHTYMALAPIVAEVCQKYGIDKIRLNRTIDTPAHPVVTEYRIDNRYWRGQGFLTTAYFGRFADLFDTDVPNGTEILVHPDFDRDGRLIDRTAVVDGFSSGNVLDGGIYREKSVILCRYEESVF